MILVNRWLSSRLRYKCTEWCTVLQYIHWFRGSHLLNSATRGGVAINSDKVSTLFIVLRVVNPTLDQNRFQIRPNKTQILNFSLNMKQ